MAAQTGAFTLAGYGALLGAFAARGYRVVAYAEVDPAAPNLILRHDVDFDLGQAVLMAEREAGLGVRATYFVLLRTEFYNPFSEAGAAAARRLCELGHDVGLHFDAGTSDRADRDLGEAVSCECGILEQVIGRAVGAFSFHRPRPALLDEVLEVPGRINAYAPRFFREMGYCSDSRGAWHYGHPLDHGAVREGRALQLLTHPIWWCSEGGMSPRAKLDRFVRHRIDVLRAEAARNCEAYSATDSVD